MARQDDAASLGNSEFVEVVQQEISDPNIEVGSGCEWRGSGAEPQWNNPKSMKAYDHIERHHGPQLKAHQFRGRMAKTNNPQGQWLSAKDWVSAEKVAPKNPGMYIIDFNRPVGRVYYPDRSITQNVTRVVIQRNSDGTLNFGYPVSSSFILSSLNTSNQNE